MSKSKVAILGTGFIAHIHVECYRRFVPDAEVVAVYGRTPENTAAFAKQYGIPRHCSDIDALLSGCDIDIVDICLPNYQHHEACMKAARADKHIIIEKPLAMTLEEADEMIAECKGRGLKLCYAEELCFAPKYERVRALVGEDVEVLRERPQERSRDHGERRQADERGDGSRQHGRRMLRQDRERPWRWCVHGMSVREECPRGNHPIAPFPARRGGGAETGGRSG